MLKELKENLFSRTGEVKIFVITKANQTNKNRVYFVFIYKAVLKILPTHPFHSSYFCKHVFHISCKNTKINVFNNWRNVNMKGDSLVIFSVITGEM